MKIIIDRRPQYGRQDIRKVSNWLMAETLRLLKEYGMELEEIRFSPEKLAKLVDLADPGLVNRKLKELMG